MTQDLKDTLCEAGIDPGAFLSAVAAVPLAETSPDFARRTVAAALDAERRGARRALRARAAAAAVLSAAAGLAIALAVCGPGRETASARALAPAAGPGQTAFREGCAPERAGYGAPLEICVLVRGGGRAAALESAVAALVASQRADGGWANPVETAWGAAALGEAAARGVPGALIASKKAKRYLKRNNLPEMSAAELAAAAEKSLPSAVARGESFAPAVAALRALHGNG